MNIKIVFTWLFLILLGFITTDFIESFYLLAGIWSGILILGCTVMVKYGWSQNKYLCMYWIITLVSGTVLSALQFLSIQNAAGTLHPNNTLLHFNHISTIWMIILGVNFIVTTVFSKIIYFAPLGTIMLLMSLPLDGVKMSFPAITYGILFSIVLAGYIGLTHLTPNDKTILGKEYNINNGLDEELLHDMHKFKCSNCGYIYEGHEKLNYCPRCMTGSDLLIDV